MFRFIGHGPSVDELLNTECSTIRLTVQELARRTSVHSFIQTDGIPHITFCNREGGVQNAKIRKILEIDILSRSQYFLLHTECDS
jgi:hypothetical protein